MNAAFSNARGTVSPRHCAARPLADWGYETMEYVEGNMTAFRDGRYPIDSFIMDYGGCAEGRLIAWAQMAPSVPVFLKLSLRITRARAH